MGSPQQATMSLPLTILALAATWLVAFLGVGSACQWLGNQHSYGAHSRAQIALAIGLCCVCATWVLAEFVRILGPLHIGDLTKKGFEAVTTAEPATIGSVAAADVEAPTEAELQMARQMGEAEPTLEVTRDNGLTGKLKLGLDALVSRKEALRGGAEMSAILAFLYICDRTEIFSKAKKVYNPAQFWGCWGLICVIALLTMRKLDNSKPLQREQTDEWKGWMQLMFLMYHYFAEKEVYNAIRVYIAAYVFMTGFGNFSLYLKGKSFTVRRTLQMLFRLNFLGFLVCVGLNNEYMLYYICAMHTLFTIFVLLAMYIKQDVNSSTNAQMVKIGITAVLTVILYDSSDQLFSLIFGTLPLVRPLFAFHDPLHPEFKDEMHEWHFRSGLDRFIWVIGMAFAMCVPSCMRFVEKLEAMPAVQKYSWTVGVAVAGMIPFGIWVHYVFLLDKYSYNHMHPYTSAVPIIVYLLMRNLLSCCRQRYLWLFAYLGRYTLETYILQFHVWMKTTGLNGSPKHLLEFIPGNYFLNFAAVSAVYLLLSIRIANITIVIRDALLPPELKSIGITWACVAGAAVVCWTATTIFV